MIIRQLCTLYLVLVGNAYCYRALFSPREFRHSSTLHSGGREEYKNPAAQILSNFFTSDTASKKILDIDSVNFSARKRKRTSLQALCKDFKKSYDTKEWFVSGIVNASFFSDDFAFQDPDVKLKGIENYARGVRKLFSQSDTRGTIIEVIPYIKDNESGITVTWRLSGSVNILSGLPIKAFYVYSDLRVNKESGLIEFQQDRFSLPGYDILLSALFPGLIGTVPFLQPPAPPL